MADFIKYNISAEVKKGRILTDFTSDNVELDPPVDNTFWNVVIVVNGYTPFTPSIPYGGVCGFKNLSDTESVDLSLDLGTSIMPFAVIPAGETAFFRVYPGVSLAFDSAGTEHSDVEVWLMNN